MVRNRVKRRLRAIMADALVGYPDGYTFVVRAQPAAATASYATLRNDVGESVARALKPRS